MILNPVGLFGLFPNALEYRPSAERNFFFEVWYFALMREIPYFLPLVFSLSLDVPVESFPACEGRE
jgi:hypothetical protein